MDSDNKKIKDTGQKYLALAKAQLIIGGTFIASLCISIARTDSDPIPIGHVFALGAMILVHAVLNGLVFIFAMKVPKDNSYNRKCSICVSIGMCVAFFEAASIIATFVSVGIYVGDEPDERLNEHLGIAVLVCTGLALITNSLTVYMGCKLGPVFSSRKTRNRQVGQTDNAVIITTTGNYGMQSRDQTHRIQELQVQNSLLQQEILLQQRQQLNSNNLYSNYGFQAPPTPNNNGFQVLPPPPSYYSGSNPEYPPPSYSSLGPPPAYGSH